jgi:hypothetical protein
LRLEAGTTEAGFLAAFCDITAIPTFIVIQNGQLQVQLKSDVSQNDFINAVRKVLGADPIPGSNSAQSPTPPATTADTTSIIAATEAEDDLYGTTEPQRTAIPLPAVASAPSSKAKGKQKATSTPDATSASPSTTTALQTARDSLRKKKREESEELARIKARIEADKAARRAQAEARKVEREQTQSLGVHVDTQPRISSRGSQAKVVNLQVRLFDGRTIRSTFPRTANLQTDVREWVDKEFSKLAADDPNINNKNLPPYFFRHILPPQPSRELSASDENQSLGNIDLAPSATLVLVPIKGYTEAYTEAGGGVLGTATGLVGGAFGLLSSTVGYVGSTIGSVIGYGTTPTEAQTGQTMESRQGQASQQPTNSDAASIRVRTLADQRARDGGNQQFYNGNQVRIPCNMT